MKEITIMFLLLLTAISFATVTVISPNGGEEIPRGGFLEIEWADNISENVKIELYQNDSFFYEIESSTASDGFYFWSTPNNLSGENLKIKISSIAAPVLHNDMSDDFFRILSGTITLLTPNGGELIERGFSYDVTWNDDIDENVKIELWKDEVYLFDIVESTESDGSFVWTTPVTDFGSGYKIKIFSIELNTVSDQSETSFEIKKGDLQLIYPVSGDIVDMGFLTDILYNSDIPEDIKVTLLKNSDVLCEFRSSSSGATKYNFYSPNFDSGNDFRLKIESVLFDDIISETGYFTLKGTNNISGSLNETWTEENSPYNITDSCFISISNTLDIRENVKVINHSLKGVGIEGRLLSKGESDKRNYFQDFKLNFENINTQDSSIIKNSDFRIDNIVFNNTFGGSSYDGARSVQQTTDGGYIIAGQTSSYDVGGGDFYLVKTDENGNEQWSKTFGGTGSETANSVQQTTDGGYIIAGYTLSYGAGSSDFYLVKTDENGNEQWSKTFGGSESETANSVQQTTDGGYIIAGYTSSYGAGSSDFWVIKTDTNGNEEWNNTFGGSSFGGSSTDAAYSIQQTRDGGYVVAGRTNYSSPDYSDLWIVKMDTDGNEEWNNIFGIAGNETANSVQQTTDGGYIVAGHTQSSANSYDFWLIKTDANGNEEWNKTFGGADWDSAYSIQQTRDEGYIVAGSTSSYGAGSGDFWVIKTDTNGNEEWSKTFGGSSYDGAYSVQQTMDGGYIVAGRTESYGAGSYDFWIIKTDANGNIYSDNTIISLENSSSVMIQNCKFSNCYNEFALELNNSIPVISNNLFTENIGGALKLTNSSPTSIINNTFVNNSSEYGGALYFDGNSDPVLMNNIIYGNTATVSGNQIYINSDDSDPAFYYNDIEGDMEAFGLNTGITYTGNYTGNIDSDPLFAGERSLSYNIQKTSPCRNAGYPGITVDMLDGLNLPQIDLAGSQRLFGSEIDMGSYEFFEVDQNIVINELLPVEGPQIINETDSINFSIDAYDPNGDDLFYSWKLDGVEVSIIATYNFTTDYTSVGEYTVTLDVTDNYGNVKNEKINFTNNSKYLKKNVKKSKVAKLRNSLNYSWDITVNDVDGDIIVTELLPAEGPQNINETDTINFLIDAYDPDGNDLTYSWKLDGTEVSIVAGYDFISNYSSAGNYVVTLDITDNYTNVGKKKMSAINLNKKENKKMRNELSYSWAITVNDVDQSIIVNELLPTEGPQTINETETINFSIDATDPDGNDLTYSWKLDGTEVSIVATYDFTTDYSSAGEYEVTLDVTDNFSSMKRIESSRKNTRNSLSYSWNITVNDIDQNIIVNELQPAEGSQNINETDIINFSIDAYDPDGNDLTYSWKLDGTEVSIVATYDFTTDYSSAGEYEVTLDVTDNFSSMKRIESTRKHTRNSLNYSWNITVNEVDQNIIVTELQPAEGSQNINEADIINFSIDAYDPDGNDLTYSWKLDGTEVSTVATFDFTTDYSSAGEYVVTLDVTDNFSSMKSNENTRKNTRNSLNYSWNITVDNVNRAPIITSFLPVETTIILNDDPLVLFEIIAEDLDGDDLLYSWFVNDENQSVNIANFENEFLEGSYSVVAIVSDEELSDSTSWSITSTVGIEEELIIPLSTRLEQNYPNPFNPITTIHYSIGIENKGYVNLTIYNEIGNKIRTLVNEKNEAGFYSVSFNGSDLSSGIYYYTIKTNNFTDMKKMILIK